MKLSRRQSLHLAAGAAALPVVPRVARAQAYPSRPVRIIVGYPAGGGADINARLMGQRLSERLGQAFVIENRPGAGGTIAVYSVVRSPLVVLRSDAYHIVAANADECVTNVLAFIKEAGHRA
jgi:tripartite-type tricarboxylate transporter receptor subunit TctC